MNSSLICCIFIFVISSSLQELTDSEENVVGFPVIDQTDNVVSGDNIESWISECATQCVSGCAQCESECEATCNKNGDQDDIGQSYRATQEEYFGSSALSKLKSFSFFFGNDKGKSSSFSNHTRNYWRNPLALNKDNAAGDCSNTLTSACVSGCQSLCSVCEYECGAACTPDQSPSSNLIQQANHRINIGPDDSQLNTVCDSTCSAMCSTCKCQCESACHSDGSLGEGLNEFEKFSFCEDVCESSCLACESECRDSCLSEVSINDENSTGESIVENGGATVTIDDSNGDLSSLNNLINPGIDGPECASVCQSVCGLCASECESSCVSGNPFMSGENDLNKKGVISLKSWYSSRFKIFELFMERQSGRSSHFVDSSKKYARNENCEIVLEAACQSSCQSVCSACQLQCETACPSLLNGQQGENTGNGELSLGFTHENEASLNEMCGQVCESLCSSCNCQCESACQSNITHGETITGPESTLNHLDVTVENIVSRCATTCDDSCIPCVSECEISCKAPTQTPVDISGADNNSPTSPPVGTKLSFDMHTRVAGEGLKVTIYFIVVQDGMKMYCDVSAQAGSTAAKFWSQETNLETDIEDNPVPSGNNLIDSFEGFSEENVGDVSSENAPSNLDVNIVTNDGTNEEISDQIPAGSRNNVDSGSCSETIPHIYILKDTSCCGDPSLPQCSAVQGKKLGCIDALGNCQVRDY